MKIGLVFHKNPLAAPSSIDIIRLRSLSLGLYKKGFDMEIIAPVNMPSELENLVPVRPLRELNNLSQYDLIKTSYHYPLELIAPMLSSFDGPVVSRIVRVVGDRLPERDEGSRERLLRCQELINRYSTVVIFNNDENARRWESFYGPKKRRFIVPNACPKIIPDHGENPFRSGKPGIIFLGSIAAPRMPILMNELALRLSSLAEVHFFGLNKTDMYGGGASCHLSPLIIDHGELPEDQTWNYLRYAHLGLALATGPYPFDNDITKIFNYLRAGLPVLSEEPIVNNSLIAELDYGRIFSFDDPGDMVIKAKELLNSDQKSKSCKIMEFMAKNHSWDNRVDAYSGLFRELLK